MTHFALDDVSIRIPLYDVGSLSLRRALLHAGTGGKLCRDAGGAYVVDALSRVSLSLKPGDRLALIGRNGAGKSTLLRLMAGIFEPTAGRILRSGRIAALLNLDAGMLEESTGYRNILTLGLMMGLSHHEIRARVDEIAAFTELGSYLDMPVRTYSSGMRLRLTFAVATAVDPDVLLIDEVVGAGDQHFLPKARQRLHELTRTAAICVIAAHNHEILREICTIGLTLQSGRMIDYGPVHEVLDRYESGVDPTAVEGCRAHA